MRLYRLLQLLFPAAFRRRFSDDMAAVFADRLRSARQRGPLAAAGLWIRTIADLAAHGMAERRARARIVHRRASMLDSWKQDMTFGWRTLRRSPGIAITAIVTLALGIGASTAVFSVADALVLQSLPYPAADRLVALTDDNDARGISVNVALPNFDDWRSSVDAIEAAAAWQTADVNLVGAAAERVSGAVVTEEFFEVVGARPMLGRTFGHDAREPGMQAVAVLSERAWRRLFGGRPDVTGVTAMLEGVPHEIVGVVPVVAGLAEVDVWRPIVRTGAAARRGTHAFRAVARLRPGVSIEQARVQFDLVAARLAAAYPETNTDWRVGVTPLQETLTEDLDQVLVLVGAVAGVLLLIACTNVAGLLVARAADRRREFAVRAALGAPGARLVRQLLTESVLLGAAGSAAGLVVAAWTTGLIMSVLPGDVVPVREPSLSLPVLGFATGLAIVTGLIFGLAPVLTSLRPAARSALQERSAITSRGTRRLRQSLVFVQIALASVLLVGTGLLLASLWRAVHVDPGFDPRSVLTFKVTPPAGLRSDESALTQYFSRLLTELAALPQVEAAGASSSLPMAGNTSISTIRRPDEPAAAPGEERWALNQISTPGYMRASGTRLLVGRDFTDQDLTGEEPVVIVNESLARELWPGESPIGREIVIEPGVPHRVIGLIGDVRHFGLDKTLYRQYFLPLRQSSVARTMGVALRLRVPLSSEELRRAVISVDPTVPLYALQSFEALAADSLTSRRSLAGTVAACGAAAVLLAAIGLYGIVATGVRDRRREIGIRLALGASARGVVGLFVRRAALLAAAAVVAGLVASYWTTGLIEEFLFGIEAVDFSTRAAVGAGLLSLSVMTTWLSARHAARVRPIEALRTE